MTLNLGSPWLSRLSPHLPKLSDSSSPNNAATTKTGTFLFLLFNANSDTSTLRNQTFSAFSASKKFRSRASLSESENKVAGTSVSDFFDDDLLNRVSAANDANEALDLIAEKSKRSGGVVSNSDCCSIISAAFDRNNVELALSIFSAMRSSSDLGAGANEAVSFIEKWKWSRPDVHTYTLLILGLAATLRVSDALKMVGTVSRVGVSPGEEFPGFSCRSLLVRS